MNRATKTLLIPAVGLLLVLVSFWAGTVYAGLGGTVPGLSALTGVTGRSEAGILVDQVDRLIQQTALVPSSESSKVAGAVRGLLGSLEDTYAAYYSPEDYAVVLESQSGEFFGVGISVGLNKDNQPYAVRVFPDSPAEKAGVEAGDVISAVNGDRRAKWDLQQFVDLVRGPAGTTVLVEITRDGKAPFELTLTRARVAIPSTTTTQYGDVGYVRLLSFNERSAADLAADIKDLDAKGVRGFVLDLRQNPGGLLVSAIDVVSLFVHDGVAVRVDERGKPEDVQNVSGNQVTGKPLVLLVDAGSASASEIVAGALKDYARATIVGEQTYGKGSVQQVHPLSNGGAVKMTIAHYLTPLRNVINGVGVTPDVIVKMDPLLQLDEKTDTQLTKALAVLRSKL
jgi:carboxyl-terminal processing protease